MRNIIPACSTLFAAVPLLAASFDLPPDSQQALHSAKRGAILAMPDIPAIPISCAISPGPQLLFSDMPEYLGNHDGICLEEDLVPGEYRLYIYHVPGTVTSPRTISAVIENRSSRILHLQFRRYAFPTPGPDYPDIGIDGLMEFFTGNILPPPIILPPGARAVLDPKLDGTVAHDPQLVHAIYEFRIDSPARLAVLQRQPDVTSTNAFLTLPKLPRQFAAGRSSGAGRGLFQTADFFVTNAPGTVIDSTQGVQRLNFTSAWITGTDAGTPATNVGNYGVIYHARLRYISSDGRALALLVGGPGRRIEARPKAAIEVNAGVWPGGWIAVKGEAASPHRRAIVELVQEFPAPPSSASAVIDITYSPPGGSSLPTPIFLAPF